MIIRRTTMPDSQTLPQNQKCVVSYTAVELILGYFYLFAALFLAAAEVFWCYQVLPGVASFAKSTPIQPISLKEDVSQAATAPRRHCSTMDRILVMPFHVSIGKRWSCDMRGLSLVPP